MDERELIERIEIKREEISKLRSRLIKIESGCNHKGKVIEQTIEKEWAMYHGDCIEVIKGLENDSIHYSIFSPPWIALYVWSDNERDMGNSKSDEEFYTHFSYLVPELYRVLKPGRLLSVHCSLINLTINTNGFIGQKDFPGALVRLFTQHNFIYHSKVMIWKDPLIQAVRTKNLTLAHKQISKDATRCAMGYADEVLTFMKPGLNEEPVAHGRGFEKYIGERPEPKQPKTDEARTNKYSHAVWQRYASPVWMDISQTKTLNYRIARDDKDERHITPLQLQVIERCLELWTNKGDIVLSPFAGIGSEGYESIKSGRRFIGIELKQSYYKTALTNLRAVTRNRGIFK
jgi:DNA modification methylase